MLKTAMQERNKRLKKMANDALSQYNKDMAKGGEPTYPDWAMDILGLIKEHDAEVENA